MSSSLDIINCLQLLVVEEEVIVVIFTYTGDDVRSGNKKVSVSLMNWLKKVSRLRVEITTIELSDSMVSKLTQSFFFVLL